MIEPEGFERFEARRGGRWEVFDSPSLHISQWGIYINRAAVKEIGNEYNYVILYYDKDNDTIGLWFWKDPVIGGYNLVDNKSKESWHITAGAFLKKYDVLKTINKLNKIYFSLVPDAKHKEFYVARLR